MDPINFGVGRLAMILYEEEISDVGLVSDLGWAVVRITLHGVEK